MFEIATAFSDHLEKYSGIVKKVLVAREGDGEPYEGKTPRPLSLWMAEVYGGRQQYTTYSDTPYGYVLYSKKASITKSSLDRIKATQEELKRKWKAKQTGA